MPMMCLRRDKRDLVELTAGGDLDVALGLPALGAHALQLLHDIHALDDLAENNVLAVQPRGLRRADKELGAVGVGTSVGHGQNS